MARDMVASRAEHGQGEHTPEWRVVVAPAKGVFARTEGMQEGEHVGAGSRLGTVRTTRDEHAVIASAPGELVEWLRSDGDIVGAGLPIARLHDEQDS